MMPLSLPSAANSRTQSLLTSQVDFAVDIGFAHAASNQLRDLGAEVQNKNLVVLHGDQARG
jgi:hypothetical protein